MPTVGSSQSSAQPTHKNATRPLVATRLADRSTAQQQPDPEGALAAAGRGPLFCARALKNDWRLGKHSMGVELEQGACFLFVELEQG